MGADVTSGSVPAKQVFFSYGHDENAPFVQALREALERLCPEISVWVDTREIREAQDWRREIAEGIMGSCACISFASAHALRTGSVCLDELYICVAVKGAQVQTVLLERGIGTEVPPVASHLQHIDASDWRDHVRRVGGSDAWLWDEEWLRDRAQTVLDFITSDEVQRYAAEVLELRNLLIPNVDWARRGEQLRIANRDSFVGRAWLSRRVADWAEGKPARPRGLLLVAGPGMGKSAFIARQLLYQQRVGSVVFAQWDDPDANTAQSVVRQIAFQLACGLPTGPGMDAGLMGGGLADYRRNLLDIARADAVAESLDDTRPLARYLVNPLHGLIDGGHEDVFVFVDALDEIAPARKGNGRVLNQFSNELAATLVGDALPRWLRFVVSSRPDPAVRQDLDGLFETVRIEDEEDENRGDVNRFLYGQLVPNGFGEREAEAVGQACDGNFLFARLLCDDLARQGPGHAVEVPGSLDVYYARYLERIERGCGEHAFKGLKLALDTVAVRAEGVPARVLIGGLSWTEKDQARFEGIFGQLLVFDGSDYRLFHKSFADYLLDPHRSGYFVCDSHGALRVLALGCLASYRRARAIGMAELGAYETLHLVEYLRDYSVANEDLRDELEQVMGDGVLAKRMLEEARVREDAHEHQCCVELADTSREIFSRMGSRRGELAAQLLAAEALDAICELDDARGRCDEALVAGVSPDEPAENVELLARIAYRRGRILFNQGDKCASRESCLLASELFSRAGNELEEVRSIVFAARATLDLRVSDACAMMDDADARFGISGRVERALVDEDPVELVLFGREPYVPAPGEIALLHCFEVYRAQFLHHMGDCPDEALVHVDRALGLIERYPEQVEPRMVAQTHLVAAFVRYGIGDYERSMEEARVAQALETRSYGGGAVETANALNHQGAVARKLGHYEEAVDCYAQALEIRMRWYGPDNPLTIFSMEQLCRTKLRDLERYGSELDEIQKELERTLRVRMSAGAQTLSAAAGLAALAAAYSAAGRHAEAARQLCAALHIHRQLGSPRDVARTLIDLAKELDEGNIGEIDGHSTYELLEEARGIGIDAYADEVEELLGRPRPAASPAGPDLLH